MLRRAARKRVPGAERDFPRDRDELLTVGSSSRDGDAPGLSRQDASGQRQTRRIGRSRVFEAATSTSAPRRYGQTKAADESKGVFCSEARRHTRIELSHVDRAHHARAGAYSPGRSA
ncbi:hypothetical protein ANO11243_003270 [Dothideomycetidae sp. 11243]|nr:hypothetical protein ANO11243_003270 [fungal sp. No.11243]